MICFSFIKFANSKAVKYCYYTNILGYGENLITQNSTFSPPPVPEEYSVCTWQPVPCSGPPLHCILTSALPRDCTSDPARGLATTHCWVPVTCISNTFPGVQDVVGLGTTLWKPMGLEQASSLTEETYQWRGFNHPNFTFSKIYFHGV